MLVSSTRGLYLAVCEGGGGPHALGMNGSRGPLWATAVRRAGATPAVLVAVPLSNGLARECELAGVEVMELARLARPMPASAPLEPPQSAFLAIDQWTSHLFVHALGRLAVGEVPVAHVEFPDRGGWAFGILQARLLDGTLAQTTISIRIEGTCSLRASFRSEPQTLGDLLLADLERKALADCDCLVADSGAVAESARAFHGFSPAHWDPRVGCDAGSYLEDAPPSVALTSDSSIFCRIDDRSTACLASLARSLAGFIQTQLSWAGQVRLIGDPPALDALLRRLGPYVGSRVVVVPDTAAAPLHGAAWLWLDMETWSHSAAPALQAAERGAVCVVSAGNPAYRDPAWRDGITCLLHDGRPECVVNALIRAFAAGVTTRPTRREVPCQPVRGTVPAAQPTVPNAARVSVVVPHYNLGAYLAETVENARHCTPPGTEIVVVDDASDDPMSRDLVGAWQRRPPAGVRVVALPFNVGLGAARNVGISEARGEYVVPLDADDLLAPGFVERAMAALQRHSAFDIVVTQAAYFEQTPAPDARPATTGFITFVGEARATGLHANRFSTAMCVMRRQTALTLRYREDLDAYEDWDMYRRALIGGCRFIVDGGVGFFYRRRADSMVHAPATKARHASLVHRVLGAHRITLGSLDLPAQALECAVVLPAMRDVGGTIDIGTLRERLEELRRFRHSRVRRLLAAIWYGGRRVARLLPASGARR